MAQDGANDAASSAGSSAIQSAVASCAPRSTGAAIRIVGRKQADQRDRRRGMLERARAGRTHGSGHANRASRASRTSAAGVGGTRRRPIRSTSCRQRRLRAERRRHVGREHRVEAVVEAQMRLPGSPSRSRSAVMNPNRVSRATETAHFDRVAMWDNCVRQQLSYAAAAMTDRKNRRTGSCAMAFDRIDRQILRIAAGRRPDDECRTGRTRRADRAALPAPRARAGRSRRDPRLSCRARSGDAGLSDHRVRDGQPAQPGRARSCRVRGIMSRRFPKSANATCSTARSTSS